MKQWRQEYDHIIVALGDNAVNDDIIRALVSSFTGIMADTAAQCSESGSDYVIDIPFCVPSGPSANGDTWLCNQWRWRNLTVSQTTYQLNAGTDGQGVKRGMISVRVCKDVWDAAECLTNQSAAAAIASLQRSMHPPAPAASGATQPQETNATQQKAQEAEANSNMQTLMCQALVRVLAPTPLRETSRRCFAPKLPPGLLRHS